MSDLISSDRLVVVVVEDISAAVGHQRRRLDAGHLSSCHRDIRHLRFVVHHPFHLGCRHDIHRRRRRFGRRYFVAAVGLECRRRFGHRRVVDRRLGSVVVVAVVGSWRCRRCCFGVGYEVRCSRVVGRESPIF